MIPGLVSQELHEQLLDLKSYQSRMNGVDELKRVLSEVEIKSVPCDSIEDFIKFLPRLLDDSNFKVLYGALQVLNLLIEKLESSVDRYFKHIVLVALKVLGDTRTLTRNEYLNVFQQLMKTVEPQQVLGLVIGNLKHKNSRVREDVLNIIMAAILTHPRKDFNIPKLCFEVAPYLADGKRRVRLAAFELFAVFDSCLDTGKKQVLMKAVDMVEEKEDAKGLSAAVQARRKRHTLPNLTPDGTLEYGLVVPKVGQWCSEPHETGADLDWVMNRGRTSNARSYRTDHDSDSLGSLTDDRTVRTTKGKNKLPWEMSSFSASENEQRQSSCPDQNTSDQVQVDEFTLVSRKSETYIPSFSSAEPQRRQSSRRGEFPSQLRRSGSLILDTHIFESTDTSNESNAAPKGRVLSRNPSVERTFSLPSNPSTPGSFLLPSYPLASHPVGALTPTLPRRHADSSLSMSNTWPNKRENSPHHEDTSPCRETAGKVKGELLSGRSPRPLRASLVSSRSTSSFRQALSSPRATFSISPVLPKVDHSFSLNGERSYNSGSFMNHQPGKNALLDSENITTWQDDAVDTHEMLNSLCSLRNNTAKRRAGVGQGSPDPDSPDSAVRADVRLNSTSHSTKALTSSASESGLSSMSSATNSSFKGIKSSEKSIMKPQVGKGPSAYLRSSMSMDFSGLQVSFQRNELLSGQRVTYSNGTINTEEDPTPPSESKIHHSGKNSPGTDIPEGVIGRGMFETTLLNSPGLSFPPEQGSLAAKLATKPLAPIFSSHIDSMGSSRSDEAKEKVKSVRMGRHKSKMQCSDQLEVQLAQEDQNREIIRHRVRQILSDSPTNESKELIIKGLHLNDSTLTPTKAESHSDDSAISPSSPPGPQSPAKCLTPPHQPSPPVEPPHPKNRSRLRRVSSLNRTRLSQSHSSDELTHTTRHQKNPSEPANMGPFSKPELVLTQSFNLLSSEDWNKKIEGLMLLRSLALHHPDTLHSNLHEVCLCVIQEVKNLRSSVSKVALCTLGELYTHLQRTMDLELEGTVKALLQKAGESNAFIRQDVDAALDCMVQHCTPTRSISALLSGGLSHLSPVVRKCAAQHLANLVKKVGAARLLSGGKNLTERILPAVAKLAQDSSQDARYYGRQILLFLSSHPDFDTLLEKYIPSKDLQTVRDTVFTLKTRGLGETPQDTQSARGRRSLPGSGTARASSLNREPLHQSNRESRSHPNCRTQAKSIADKTEYIQQISDLLASKDFKDRIKGIDQIVADCQDNPNMVINSMFPVFDALKARLQESNSKVNLYALESLQKIIHLLKDNLSQVVNILVPAIVDNHLNSKNNAIYSAAVGAINALISNLDNMLLLQPFCTKAQFLSGKAKVDLIEKVADLVTELYPRKPQTVEQKVLPLLWHLLGTSTHSGTTNGRGSNLRGATVGLCQAMYAQMGPSLSECAASQPASVHKDLNEILRALP